MVALLAVGSMVSEGHESVLYRLGLLLALCWLNTWCTARLVVVFFALSLVDQLAIQQRAGISLVVFIGWNLLVSISVIYVVALRDRLRQEHQQMQENSGHLQSLIKRLELSLAQIHDIRQPATSLNLTLRQLIHSVEQTPSCSSSTLDTLYTAFESSSLLNERLAAARSLLQEDGLKIKAVSLEWLIEQCLQELQPRLQAHQILCQCHSHLPEGTTLSADECTLRLAILNLLNNAIDELQHCLGKRLLMISLHWDRETIVLAVEDSGPGFPHGVTRGARRHSTKSGGLGLGLRLVEGISDAHHAQLSYGRSSRYGGARVALSFPLPSSQCRGSSSAPAQRPLLIQNH